MEEVKRCFPRLRVPTADQYHMEQEDEERQLLRILFLQTNDDQLSRSLLNLIDKTVVNERRGSAKNWLIQHDRNPALTG